LRIRRFEVKKGEKFLVAEDVITTGSAVREVIQLVKEAGGEVVGVACLVDRSCSAPDLGVSMCSLMALPVETFDGAKLPKDLREIPAVKPGSG
jgi:orotate phosphoribosyltransferase